MHGQFEQLETRRLFASAIYEPLIVNGTDAADSILVEKDGDFVKITTNGTTTSHRWKATTIPGSTPDSQILLPGISKLVIYGKSGDDTIDATQSPVTIEAYGGSGRDSISGSAFDDLLMGPEQRPAGGGTTHTSEYNGDVLSGGAGNDNLVAAKFGSGTTLNGGDGNDILWGSDYGDSINAGRGNDTVNSGKGNDNIVAGPAILSILTNNSDNDIVDSSDGNDTVEGGIGNDTLIAGIGNDLLRGGSGNDSFHCSDGNDTAYGDAGSDKMYGGEGNDLLNGGAGHDSIQGHGGNDSIWGDAGNDTVQGGMGTDVMQAGDGFDTVSYADHSKPVKVGLTGAANNGQAGENDLVTATFEAIVGGLGNDTLIGNTAANKLYGGSGHDFIDGRENDDSIFGESGNDSLQGNRGADKIYGNAGHDYMWGGRDADSLFGGDGNDVFVTIGGTSTDKSWGEGGTDSFWIDNAGTEYLDATVAEHNDGRVHKISSFNNSSSMELDGQDLWDPYTTTDAIYWTKFSNRPLFSSKGPTIDDVNQGNLGDCYFLAGLGSIAKQGPGWIRERIADLGDGTYVVKFGSSHIRLDSQLPTSSPNASNPAFAGFGLEGSMWVPIMEKAFAYWRDSDARSYGSISGGQRDEPFDAIGIQNEDFWDGDNDDLLNGLKNALLRGDAVTASSESGDFEHGMMIVPSHVYSVVSVDVNKQLIRVRNPWKTDAGNDASDWNDGNNDGYITLSVSQFRSKFRDTTIAYI